MSFKYTPATLRKLEQVFEAAAFVVRYEKGTFQSGRCLLEDRKVAVVNRFLSTEGRINALLEMVPNVAPDTEKMNPELLKFYLTLQNGKTNPKAVENA